MIFGIWCPDITARDFRLLFLPLIHEILEDPQHHIITSDHSNVLTKYLHKEHYRNITIYHPSDIPNNNIGNWKTLGKFQTYAEIYGQLLIDSDKFYSKDKLEK